LLRKHIFHEMFQWTPFIAHVRSSGLPRSPGGTILGGSAANLKLLTLADVVQYEGDIHSPDVAVCLFLCQTRPSISWARSNCQLRASIRHHHIIAHVSRARLAAVHRSFTVACFVMASEKGEKAKEDGPLCEPR